MMHFQHVKGCRPIVAGIRFDTRFIQNDPCVFSRDLFVIHHQYPYVLRVQRV